MRGLVVLHQLLLGKPTGKADYPGWMLEQFPIQTIDAMRGSVEVGFNELARELPAPDLAAKFVSLVS